MTPVMSGMDTVLKTNLFAKLPPIWPDDTLRSRTADRIRAENRCIVALDDDPTGCQTVHDTWVLTTWQADAIKNALADNDPSLFILTNSRSLAPEQARTVTREAAGNVLRAARQAGRPVTLVSRSDSTLRGHFPLETDAISEAVKRETGTGFDGVCLIPFFPEGGRYTVNNIHYVAEGDMLVPAGETPYARDATFGYRQSDLRAWVEEKTGGTVKAGEVATVSVEELRTRGPEEAERQLKGLSGGKVVVINAAHYRDLEVFVTGLQAAETQGKRFLIRSAASLVKAASGLDDQPLLNKPDLNAKGPGLVVFGSHVPKSTAQLEAVKGLPGTGLVALVPGRILDPGTRQETIERAAHTLTGLLAEGREAVLFTGRTVIKGKNTEESLAIARQVSAAVMDTVRSIGCRPGFVIGKGGITSHELAAKAMDVTAARVLGQVLPGVPVWRLGGQCRWPGIPYVVFPGNVGDEQAVAKVIAILR